MVDADASSALCRLIFGVIGLAAFVYGRKNALWKPMAIGLALGCSRTSYPELAALCDRSCSVRRPVHLARLTGVLRRRATAAQDTFL